MKACILYYSQTGNTKKFAETISKALNNQTFDTTTTKPSIINDYDTILIGTPVHGFNPSKEILEFIKKMPNGKDKKTVLFCTCRIWKGRTFGKLKKELKKKGYSPILCVSAKGKQFTENDFTEQTTKIVEKLKQQN